MSFAKAAFNLSLLLIVPPAMGRMGVADSVHVRVAQHGHSHKTRMVFIDEDRHLAVVRPDGSHYITIFSGASAWDPQWSPDGRHVVFICDFGDPYENEQQEICSIDVRTGRVKQLTHNQAIDFSPDWSPSGKRIAFIHKSHVVVMRSDGSNQHRVVGGGNVGSLGWRYSRMIVIGKGAADGGDIYLLSPRGDYLQRVNRRGRGDESDPEWAPGARRIIFIRLRWQAQVWAIRRDRTHDHRLTNGCCGTNNPGWSPTGRRVIFDQSGLVVARPSGAHARRTRCCRGSVVADWSWLGRPRAHMKVVKFSIRPHSDRTYGVVALVRSSFSSRSALPRCFYRPNRRQRARIRWVTWRQISGGRSRRNGRLRFHQRVSDVSIDRFYCTE